MGRCCDGKNAYKSITKTRYLAGFFIFMAMHFQFRVLLFLRQVFIKKYSHYNIISEFYKAYYKDIIKELREKKGMVIKHYSCLKK